MKRIPNHVFDSDNQQPRFRQDRFIPSKVHETNFQMHEEILSYTNSRNIVPRTHNEFVMKLFIQKAMPHDSIEPRSNKKANILKIRNNQSSETLFCDPVCQKKVYSYNIHSTCNLNSEEASLNSNARIMDYSKHRVLYISFENTIYGYNSANNKTEPTFTSKTDIYSIKFNDFSNSFMALALKNGVCEIADLKHKISLRTFYASTEKEKITALEWTSDSLVTGSNEGEVLKHDLRVKEKSVSQLLGHSSKIVCAKSNALNENYLISSDIQGVVCLNDCRKGLVRKSTLHSNCVRSLSWSNLNANMFASVGKYDGRIIQWNISRDSPLNQVFTDSNLYNVDYTYDGNLITSCGRFNNELTIYDASNLEKIVSFAEHKSSVYQMVLNQSRNEAVSCAKDGKIKFWDLRNSLDSQKFGTAISKFDPLR